ncbi:VCBS domain-containing protein [Endozoicomonadaceae bacterium StTr2]
MDKPQNPKKTSAPFQRKPLITALEPRILLDGAAVATTADMATDVAYQQTPDIPSQPDDNKVAEETAIAPTSSARREVAFIDSRVADSQLLINNLPENTDIYLIDSEEDGLAAMARILDTYKDVDTLHVFSHGDVGEFRLGSATVDSQALESYASVLNQIGSALTSEGDILLYGCRTGATEAGENFINRFATLTGADIAASDDLTGARALGGDWELEIRSGQIESTSIVANEYQSVLNPAISSLASSITVTEGGSPVVIDNDVTVSGGGTYSEGYIRFAFASNEANSGDQLTLNNAANVNADGAISVSGNDVYLGNGTSRDRIGSIDATENGQNGKALKILFSSPLPNSGFENGTADWTIKNERYGDNGLEINLHNYDVPVAGTSTTAQTNVTPTSVNYTGSVETHARDGDEGNHSLKLTLSGSVSVGYGSAHGPSATSSVFVVEDGDSLSLDFYAKKGSDDYEVFGLLRKVNPDGTFVDNSLTSNNNIVLFAERGQDTGGYKTVTKTGLSSGSYRFEFVGGTYDRSGGQAVGSSLYIDNIRLTSSTTANDAVVSAIARQVAYQTTADDAPVARTLTISTQNEAGNTASDTLDININPVNDAPSFTGNASLASVNEDTTSPAGASVSSLFSSRFSDPDSAHAPADTLAGIVITANSATAGDGVWQYSTNNGSSWYDVSDRTSTSGLVLSADTLLRFKPAADFNGTPGNLSVHAIDSSYSGSFTTNGNPVIYNTGSDSTTSPVSASSVSLSTTINPVQDAPEFSSTQTAISKTETNGTLSGSGSIQLSDPDRTDVVNVTHTVAAVQQNSSGNTVTSSTREPGNAALAAMLSFSASPNLSASETSKQFNWQFNSGSESFDYLQPGEKLLLTYTLRADDGQGGITTQNITVTINGSDDAPSQSLPATQGVQEDNNLVFSSTNGNSISVQSGDDEQLTTTITVDAAVGTLLITNTGSASITGNGSRSVQISGSQSAINAALQGLTLRPAGNYNDAAALTITTSDGTTTRTGTVTVNIAEVNDTPTASNDTGSAYESSGTLNQTDGAQASGNVLNNDSDIDAPDGDSLKVSHIKFGSTTLTVSSGSSRAINGNYGTLQIFSDGRYTYDINENNPTVQALRNAGQTLTESFTYTAADTGNLSTTATLTITIAGRNDAPVAQNDTGQAVESGGTDNGSAGSNASGNVLSNDTDVESGSGDTLKVATISFNGSDYSVTSGQARSVTSSYGTLTINADGSYSYAINESHAAVQALRVTGQQLTETFTYQVQDSDSLGDTGQLTITIDGRNDAPVASADTGLAVESGGVNNETAGSDATGNVLTNDTDVESTTGDTLRVAEVTFGSTTLTVDSGQSRSITGTYGTLRIHSDGSYTYEINENHAAVQALHAAGQQLTEQFSYRVMDSGNLSATSTLSITIDGRNDAPAFVDPAADGGSSPGNTPQAGETISTYDVTEGPVNTPLALGQGDSVRIGFYIAANADSNTWQNAKSFYDAEVGMSTVVYDSGSKLNTHTLDVELLFVMQPIDAFTPDEIASMKAFLDKGGRLFFIGEHNGYKPAENGHISTAITDLGGNITVLGGTYTQTGHSNTGEQFNLNNSPLMAGVNTFTTAAFAQLQIDSNISKAVVVDNSKRIVMADQALSYGRVTVLADQNWLNSGILSSTDNKTFLRNLAIDSLNAVQLVENGGNPNAEFDVASGLVETNAGLTGSGTITLTDVDTANTVTVTHTVSAEQQGADGNPVTSSAFEPSSAELQAMFSLTPDPALTNSETTKDLSWNFNSGSTAFNYLKAGEKLVLTYTLRADDSNGGIATQDVTITINGTDDKPAHNLPASQTVSEDHNLVFSDAGSNAISLGITDDEQLTTTLSVAEGVGTLLLTNTIGVDVNGNGSRTLQLTGSRTQINAALQGLTFRPATDRHGSVSLDISTSDGQTTRNDNLAITISPVNDAPTALSDSGAAVENSGTLNQTTGSVAIGNVLSNDTDVDITTGDSLTVTRITFYEQSQAVEQGSSTVIAGRYGTLTINPDGGYVYRIDETNAQVQALRASGQQLTETFSYQMQDAGDPQGEKVAPVSSAAQLVITLDGRNDAPVANDDTATAIESGGINNTAPGTNATGNVLTNDSDVEYSAGDRFEVTAISFGNTSLTVTQGEVATISGRYGTLQISADGSYTYIIDNNNPEVEALRSAGQQLLEQFTYRITDNTDPQGNTQNALSDNGLLTITIEGRNDTPVTVIDTATAVESSGTLNATVGRDATGNALANDTDVETGSGDRLQVTRITFGFESADLVSGNPATIAGRYGTLTIHQDGSYSYKVNEDHPAVQALRTPEQKLIEYFNYRVRDNADNAGNPDLALDNTGQINIIIEGRNDAPVATDDAATAVESHGTLNSAAGSNATGNVLANDSDVESSSGDQLIVTEISFGQLTVSVTPGEAAIIAGQYGALHINADGSYTYRIDEANQEVEALRSAGQQLTERFSYRVQDNADNQGTAENALDDTGLLTVTIEGRNDAPVAVNDTATAIESGGLQNSNTGSNATGNVMTNDTDVETTSGDRMQVTEISFGDTLRQIQAGNETTIAGLYGTLAIQADGSYRYEINEDHPDVQALRITGQQLVERFVYRVQDNSDSAGNRDLALTDTATLTIIIDGRNDVPVALAVDVDEKWDFGRDYQKDIAVLFTDVDSVANGEVFTFTITGLPGGLEYDPASGVISGIPTEPGIFTIFLTATDRAGTTAARTFELEIIAPPKPEARPDTSTGQNQDILSLASVEIEVETSDLPDGTIDQLGTQDPADSTGFVDDRPSSVPVIEPVAEQTEIGNPLETSAATAAVDVNINRNGEVTFDTQSQQVMDNVSLRIADVRTSDQKLHIEIMDTKSSSQFYSCTLTDGSPLPEWISVDPDTGNIEASPPAGTDQLTIKLKATGFDGSSQTLEIKLDFDALEEDPSSQEESDTAGFVPLNEQLENQARSQHAHGEQLVNALAKTAASTDQK